MHPAISVIFFTVTSGAGFGLMALIGFGWPVADDRLAAFLVCALSGGLAVAGLVSSTFHLGHPERAWRALSQWRSSWLSREGVLAILTLALFSSYALYWLILGVRPMVLGIVSGSLAALTVFSTAMIYSSLRTVPSWHSVLTPACYLGFSLSSGMLLASSVGQFSGDNLPFYLAAVLAGLVVSWLVKLAWWRRSGGPGIGLPGTDTGTATGLGKLGKVRLLERPHSGDNYLTKEMVHRIGRKHAAVLRSISLAFGFALPTILVFLAWSAGSQLLLWPASASMLLGLVVERWLFFAEARHSVSLYYD
jgi:sulfite dehydrogenase (quinone) subunit SoeC